MLSRVADSLYWMSRYIERAENVARFIDVNFHLMLDLSVKYQEQWEPLINITADNEIFYQHYDVADKDNVIHFLTFDLNNPNSIVSCVKAARENARSIRDTISSEMWEQINVFNLMLQDTSSSLDNIKAHHQLYTDIKMASLLLAGITDATMSHGESWHFCRLGRMLERADKTTRLIDVKYFYLLPTVNYIGTPYDDMQWTSVLKSASGFEMYRKLYHRISPEKVVKFLLLDRTFPRSVNYCLIKADESLHAISDSFAGTFTNKAEQSLGQLRSELAFVEVNEIIA
ncbi:MAG: alpha-E domain-containing protein, partial [Cyanobacteriota bacterium]